MSRRSWVLWAAAMLTALAPSLYFWVSSLLSGDDGARYYAHMFSGRCTGAQIHSMIPEYLSSQLPLFDYGGAPLLVLALAGRYVGARTRRDRLGRVVARCAAAVLLLQPLLDLLLFSLDGAFGPECLAAWGPSELLSLQAGWDLYHLVPPVLVLLAVQVPRRAFVRRGRLARTAATILTVTATLLVTAQAGPAGKVSTESELDCAGFGDGTVKGLSEAEKKFLCEVRGYSSFYDDGGIEGWQDAPDQVVVTQGHHLCRVATRHGGDTGAPAVRDAPPGPLAHALGTLCPAVARWQEQEGARKMAEEAAYRAAAAGDQGMGRGGGGRLRQPQRRPDPVRWQREEPDRPDDRGARRVPGTGTPARAQARLPGAGPT